MHVLQQKVKELLESGKVQIFLGYGAGTGDRVRPMIIRTAAEVSKLLWNDRCRQNLAVYLNKPEIKKMGMPALIATPVVVHTIIQLITENQLKVDGVLTLVVENGSVKELSDTPSLEAYAESHPVIFPSFVKQEIKTIAEMSLHERFKFWQDEFSRCIKCYACRSACPLCYCERCITDNNLPQWISPASHAQGNFEWHVNRAMHLAGRCVQCGSCTIACPVGIPIGLLTIEASRIVGAEFGQQPGLKCDAVAAMSSFKVEDTETFIK
jgi:ferredoxin